MRVGEQSSETTRRLRPNPGNPPARIWIAAAVVLLLVLAAYWHFAAGGGSPAPAHHPVAPVRVARIERRNMAVVEHTLGTIIADSTVQVRARVQGMLETAYFREGQFVKKGDPLFQIDPRPFQIALAQARASLQHDQALLRNAERDRLRYERLFKEKSASLQQLDAAAANADALAATLAVDKAAVDSAQLDLRYARIQSPVNGKTGPLLVQPGNMVSGSPSAVLVTIEQLRPVKLSFSLPQSDYWRIRARKSSDPLLATIEPPRALGRPLSAPVDFTGNAVDSQSGTIELRATFANDDLSLLPGETVDVTAKLSELPNALVVPRDALNFGPNGPYLFVVVDGRAAMRPVTVGFDDGKNVSVTGNLKSGDAVIVEGQLSVVPGEPVKTLPPVPIHMSPSDRNLGPQYGPNGPSG